MKKFLILIPIVIFGCIDTEMTIPGEIVGNIDDIDTEDPVVEVNLTKYQSNYPNAEFEIDINDDGLIKNIDDKNLAYTNNQISAAEIGNNNYSLTYNGNALASIKNNSNNDVTSFTKNNNSYTATTASSSGGQKVYTFLLNDKDYIYHYDIDFGNANKMSVDMSYDGQNITQVTFAENNIDTQVWAYAYDSQPNPLQEVGVDYYNTLIILEAINSETGRTPALLSNLLLLNSNNMIQSQTNSLVFNITYDYLDHYPQEGKVKNAAESIQGNVKYTYQD